jgi:hypothetical protein
MATEQQIYEMLTRIDHPVFKRDMSAVTDQNSPWNSIWNRLLAKQFVRLQTAVASLAANAYPYTCDANTIDRWEETYFNFTKPDLTLTERRTELLVQINRRFTMSEPDVEQAAFAITGQTPTVIRNGYYGGWILDESVLDFDTIFNADSDGTSTYWVIFSSPVDSALLKLLDEKLTGIEKGGSRHIFVLP